MSHPNHQLIRDYFAAMPSGKIPAHLLTEDFSGWTTLQGHMDGASYLGAMKFLGILCATPMTFIINSLTAEDDRVVAEAESQGTLVNGEEYRNTYIFVFRVRDNRIASVAEHFNAVTVREKLVPLMQTILAKSQ